MKVVFGKVDEKFNEVAAEFDQVMLNLIPGYRELLRELVAALPQPTERPLEVIDLGCGTGNIGVLLRERFPQVSLTCLDFSEEMLKLAGEKLGTGVRLVHADLNEYDFDRQYDAIVSSLTLHHLADDRGKQAFYHKIYAALRPGGVHLNAENVLSMDEHLQARNIADWRAFMAKSYSDREIDEKWLAGYYDDDRPINLPKHFEMMRLAGFSSYDVIEKSGVFALLYARK